MMRLAARWGISRRKRLTFVRVRNDRAGDGQACDQFVPRGEWARSRSVGGRGHVCPLGGFRFRAIDGLVRRPEARLSRSRKGRSGLKGSTAGVAAVSHEILVSLSAFPDVSPREKSLRDRCFSHFRRFAPGSLARTLRNRGTVPPLRARLVWILGSAESIAAVNELSKAPRSSRRESVNPVARRPDLPGGGWM